MRLLLLTARPDLEVNRRLQEAATALGHHLEIADACRVCAVTGGEPALWCGKDDLIDPLPAAVIARVGNWRPESILAALEVAESAGIVTSNRSSAIRVARDHWLTVQSLAEAGFPVPETVAGADPEELARVAAGRLGLPVVVKQRRSRMGVGVIRCETRDHLDAVLDSLWRVGDEMVVQRYVESAGSSQRLLVVGEDVVAAARFTAGSHDWRSNAARGGSAEPYSPGQEESQLAVAAARRLGLGICGVDLLTEGRTHLICEVNPTPGFRHLESATGSDVAGAIIGYTTGLIELSE
jgi:RimK family alpha-L-glutamate ligase